MITQETNEPSINCEDNYTKLAEYKQQYKILGDKIKSIDESIKTSEESKSKESK